MINIQMHVFAILQPIIVQTKQELGRHTWRDLMLVKVLNESQADNSSIQQQKTTNWRCRY